MMFARGVMKCGISHLSYRKSTRFEKRRAARFTPLSQSPEDLYGFLAFLRGGVLVS